MTLDPLRVHYDHQVFSLQNTGGNSRYHFELMRQMAASPGVEQVLFLGFYQSQMPFARLAAHNVRVVGRPSSIAPGTRRYLLNEALNNAFASYQGRFDIYHPTHHRYLPMVRHRRMVVTHHDCTAEKYPADFRYHQRIRSAKEKLYARADAILCISEASRQDLLHYYGVDAAQTRVVHHGIASLPRSPGAAAELDRQVRRDYLLYVGWRAGYKNFHGLLRAFRDSRLSRSLDLVVIGGGPLSPPHQQLIAELGLRDSVVVLERTGDELLAEAYARARLLAYPSWSEGFGFPPLEAMALGCPVLACHASSLPEICGDAPFYYQKDAPDSLVEALQRAVSDDSARAKAIERGTVIASRYSWESCAEKTLAVYREVLGEPSENYGGEGEIRTPGTLTSTSDFESGAFNHSATSPLAVAG
jgi:glycosyltransferase involved in cell wall biosynthesis